MVRIWCFYYVARVQSLVGELKSHKPHGAAKNANKILNVLILTAEHYECSSPKLLYIYVNKYKDI